MATKKKPTGLSTTDFSKVARSVIDNPLQEEVEKSFLSYAYMVIMSRAIADARDGLKPVQRRILWAMLEEGTTPEKNHKKSAQTVGSVMGNYHPHGDVAIYEAMVRLAQSYSMRVPLIDGHGNFGTAPGDSAAASRYTESRLSHAALQLMADIREDSVPMLDNYSSTKKEPLILPVRFPNSLINGGTGIAVGFATNMAPHNPSEIMDAARWLLTHPNASVEKLMEFVPGPDFPTGGQIVGVDAIKQAYETGRGVIRMRARWHVKDLTRGRKQVVFTELPYGVSIENVMDKVKDALSKGKLQSLSDMKDLSDRVNGTYLAIDLKTGTNVDVAVAELFKETPLEESFGINNVVIHDGEPQTLGLKELLEVFIAHRVDVVVRRSEFRKNKKAARLHLVEALLKALASIDAVIKIVRSSENAEVARNSLMKKYKLDEVQANYILAIPLSQLTRYDQIKLEDEKKSLLLEIKELETIISDEKVRTQLIAKEMDETKKLIGSPRRSEIVGVTLAEAVEATKAVVQNANAEIPDEPCYITLTLRGGLIQSSKPSQANKLIRSEVFTSTRGKFIAVTNLGRGFRLESLHVGTREQKVSQVLPAPLNRGEVVIAVTPVELADSKAPGGIAMGTRNGVVKVVTPTWPKTLDDFEVISLEPGDEVIGAKWIESTNDYDFAFVSSASNVLRFEAKNVRPSGLTAGGVAGMKLVDNAKVLAFNAVPKDELASYQFSTCTGKSIKTSMLDTVPVKGRATQGVRGHAFRKGEDALVLASVAVKGVLLDHNGKTLQIPEPTKRDASGTPLENPELF